MITAIPDQPIDFTGSHLIGCDCDTIIPPILFNPEADDIIFQMGVSDCSDNLIDNPNFVGVNWRAGLGWTLFQGEACGAAVMGATLTETSFTPTPGTEYTLILNITSVRDTVTWAFGGSSGTLGTSGTTTGAYIATFSITATAAAGLVITLDTDDSAVCMSLLSVTEASRDITVDLISSAGATLLSFNPASDPEAFDFTDGIMTFTAGLAGEDISGCFNIRVTEDCGGEETVLESNSIRATLDTCTIKIRACNGLGFTTPLELRIAGKVGRPSWEYDVSEERRSNGRIVRNYIDAERTVSMFIRFQSEHTHRFLSKLPLFSSVFVEDEEFIVNADGYEPGYGDVFIGTGGVEIKMKPKQELRRTVLCDEEAAPCPPPPNLWVQGTGPNDDLILLQNGKAVLLHS